MGLRLRYPYLVMTSLVLFAAASVVAQEQKTNEQIVIEGIKRQDEAMRSPDPEVRLAAIKETLLTREEFDRLFGPNRENLWKLYQAVPERFASISEQARGQVLAKGALLAVEVEDARAEQRELFKRPVLEVIPKDVPAYTVVGRYEKGASSFFISFVLDGKFRYGIAIEELASQIAAEAKK